VDAYESSLAQLQADIPMTGLSAYIADLAKRHGVAYVKIGSSALAQVITRLSGDDGNPDETEKLVIALRRANVIDGRTMVTLLGRYFDETRNDREASMTMPSERTRAPLLQKMTFVDFLAWEEHQPERHEFFRGEIFAMVGGTARHNRVILNLASRIGDHLDGTTCQVFAENMKVQIAEGVLYPDVMVTCGKAEAGDEQTVTDPKLIIEVLSPGTGGYDKRDKFILYRTLESLRQYTLIDPAKRKVEVFTLADGGIWTLTDQTAAEVLTLASIDCKLAMELVFKGVESL